MKAIQISALTFAIQSFVTLFVIMDPTGATPIFLALVAKKLQQSAEFWQSRQLRFHSLS